MQNQTCSQPGFTLPDISRYRRWAFTPPLHLYCRNSNIFSVALSSPSRALGFPKQACYFDCPDFPHNLCPRSRSTCAVALRFARLDSGTVTGCSLKLPLHRHALHTPLPSLSLNVCSRTTFRSARLGYGYGLFAEAPASPSRPSHTSALALAQRVQSHYVSLGSGCAIISRLF